MELLAMDTVCVAAPDGFKYGCELYVKFQYSSTVTNMISPAKFNFDQNRKLKVYCNSVLCDIVCLVGEDLRVRVFATEEEADHNVDSYFLTNNILQRMPLAMGENKFIFVHESSKLSSMCSIWLWSISDRLIVVDIDGTITRSDVRGYIQTVFLQAYTYHHVGIAEFFNYLERRYLLKVVFLSSRPIAHMKETKLLLESLRKRSLPLPRGPLLVNRDNIAKAAYKELILRVSADYKAAVLIGINSIFHRAIVVSDEKLGMASSRSSMNRQAKVMSLVSPFVLGFGNKNSDAVAYMRAGISPNCVFLIDPNSRIHVYGARNSDYDSSDEKLDNSRAGSLARLPVKLDSDRSQSIDDKILDEDDPPDVSLEAPVMVLDDYFPVPADQVSEKPILKKSLSENSSKRSQFVSKDYVFESFDFSRLAKFPQFGSVGGKTVMRSDMEFSSYNDPGLLSYVDYVMSVIGVGDNGFRRTLTEPVAFPLIPAPGREIPPAPKVSSSSPTSPLLSRSRSQGGESGVCEELEDLNLQTSPSGSQLCVATWCTGVLAPYSGEEFPPSL